jgi:7-cyano-7-deazaguanine synthase
MSYYDRGCLVVLSGGQDSTTVLFWAKKWFKEVHAITFDYDQRHKIEIEAAKKVAQMAEVKSHEIVILGPILDGTSPLTDHNKELEQYETFDAMDSIIGNRIEKTFVPMRNALFLTIAANKAVCKGIVDLACGVCEADNANYPDCRGVFLDAQNLLIVRALGLDIGRDAAEAKSLFRIYAPLLGFTKAQSIRLAMSFKGAYEALAYSHTSYDGKYPPTGKDHATVLRAKGFEEAGVPDPLILRAWKESLMELPETANYDKVRGGK